jgi:putative ABC transport system permease protein
VVVRRANASEPALDLTDSYPRELIGLRDGEARISSIAAEVAQLHAELVRLRGESEAVERLLDDRQAEIAEQEASLTRLADESARAHEEKAEAAAALTEAEARLEDSRARVTTLEDELAKSIADGDAELAEKEASLTRLADESARAHEEKAEAAAALTEAEARLEDSRAHVTTLEDEAALLRTQITDLETRLADESARAQEGRAEATAGLTEAEGRLEDSRARVLTLEDEAAVLRAQIADLEMRRISPTSEPEPSPLSHVRLVPDPSGYRFYESAEPLPNVGESVEIDGRPFTVVRTGPSPLPLDTRPCVFLVAEVERVWER